MKNDMATDLFGRNDNATAIVQHEGQDAFWVDGHGQVKAMTLSMRTFWLAGLVRAIPDMSGARFRTIRGIFKIVNGEAVRLLETDFTIDQLRTMPYLYPPSDIELVALFNQAMLEMNPTPPTVPPIETPKGPLGATRKAKKAGKR